MGDLIFLDVETTGLDPARHAVWEIAWAGEQGAVASFMVPVGPVAVAQAAPEAMRINRFHERYAPSTDADAREVDLYKVLHGATIVGANPAFDTAFLAARWSERPWHHRLIDIETYAMPILGLDRPVGLATLAEMIRERFGVTVVEPNHSAALDVLTTRAIWYALLREARRAQVSAQEQIDARGER